MNFFDILRYTFFLISWISDSSRFIWDNRVVTHEISLHIFSGHLWTWYYCWLVIALRQKWDDMAPKLAYDVCEGETHQIPIKPNHLIRGWEATLVWVYLVQKFTGYGLDIIKHSMGRKLCIQNINNLKPVWFIYNWYQDYCWPCSFLICEL